MIRRIFSVSSIFLSTAAAAQISQGPSLPPEKFATISSYDAPLPTGMFPADKQMQVLRMIFPFPVYEGHEKSLPKLIERSSDTPLWEGSAGPLLLQRVYTQRVEYHWLASVDSSTAKASLCKLIVRPDHLPKGVMIEPHFLINFLVRSKCQFREMKELPLALLKRAGPDETVEPPLKTATSKTFTDNRGMQWKATIVAASRGVPGPS